MLFTRYFCAVVLAATPMLAQGTGYPAQRYFIEYLKHQHGEDAFAAHLRQAIAAPDQTSGMFEESFHRPMANAIAAYRNDVGSGAWPPAE